MTKVNPSLSTSSKQARRFDLKVDPMQVAIADLEARFGQIVALGFDREPHEEKASCWSASVLHSEQSSRQCVVLKQQPYLMESSSYLISILSDVFVKLGISNLEIYHFSRLTIMQNCDWHVYQLYLSSPMTFSSLSISL